MKNIKVKKTNYQNIILNKDSILKKHRTHSLNP